MENHCINGPIHFQYFHISYFNIFHFGPAIVGKYLSDDLLIFDRDTKIIWPNIVGVVWSKGMRWQCGLKGHKKRVETSEAQFDIRPINTRALYRTNPYAVSRAMHITCAANIFAFYAPKPPWSTVCHSCALPVNDIVPVCISMKIWNSRARRTI